MGKIKKNYFKKNYSISFNYIRENKTYIYFILSFFIFFFIFGLIFPIFFIQEISDLINKLRAMVENLTLSQLILHIFFNNLQASFFGVVFGIVLGIMPLFFTLSNAYILGFVSSHVIREHSLLELWKLFPHGIFEFPAIIISFGMGFSMGLRVMKNYFRKFKKEFNMVLLGIFAIFVGIFSLIFLQGFIALISDPGEFKMEINPFLFSIVLLFFGIVMFLCFFIVFFLFDKELRKENIRILTETLRVFIFVVIPLLIVAAIIEGILISFIG